MTDTMRKETEGNGWDWALLVSKIAEHIIYLTSNSVLISLTVALAMAA